MLKILVNIFILQLFLFQNIKSEVKSDSCNIYCSALKEYIAVNDKIRSVDTIVVLNKSNLLLSRKLSKHTLIIAYDDNQIIKQFNKNIAFEIFPKKWEVLFTKVSILKFYVEKDKITTYGSVDLLFRRRFFFGKYQFIKMKSYAI
jgi:hypothetical protein